MYQRGAIVGIKIMSNILFLKRGSDYMGINYLSLNIYFVHTLEKIGGKKVENCM